MASEQPGQWFSWSALSVAAYLLHMRWTDNIRAVNMSIHAKHWHSSEISLKIHVWLYLDDDERTEKMVLPERINHLYVCWTNGTHAVAMH